MREEHKMLPKMSIQQRDSILKIVEIIKDITLIDVNSDPEFDSLSDTNILLACMEVSMRILSCNDDARNIPVAEKLKHFVFNELMPAMNICGVEADEVKE